MRCCRTYAVVVPPFLGPYVASKFAFDALAAVADEITRVLALPVGAKPFRSVIDFTDAGVDEVNTAARQAQEAYLSRMGFGELLTLKR